MKFRIFCPALLSIIFVVTECLNRLPEDVKSSSGVEGHELTTAEILLGFTRLSTENRNPQTMIIGWQDEGNEFFRRDNLKPAVSPAPVEGAEEENLPDTQTIWTVMNACRRILHFFRHHLTEMNFDAVIGTRIAEAQLKLVLEALEKNGKNGDGLARKLVLENLHSLFISIKDLNSVAKPFVRAAFPEYYNELCMLLEPEFWEVPLMLKQFTANTELVTTTDRVLHGVEQLIESQSDRCLKEVGAGNQGNGLDNACIHNRCVVSQECWDLMTNSGYSGYSLTHQVFFIIIGLQAGCKYEIERLAESTYRNVTAMTTEKLLEEFCLAILKEANAISDADFPERRQDLFMEQGALCGLVGYRDFFRKHWLAKVLSWQRSSGCYGDALKYYSDPPQESPLGGLFPAKHTRTKREEKTMSEHCLAHRTTVAFGYLSLYIRYLVLALFG
ncbi:hypothetical protein SK128_023850 [Halocaridina rubra]|uniref:Uncharacterized protein n=1 Tax=Halocaridina rubra TaxID=373956 RepID=A0AAN8XNB7_HALRR